MSILAFEVVFVSQLSIGLNVEKDKMGKEMINRQVMSLPSSSSIHLTPVHQNQFMDHLSCQQPFESLIFEKHLKTRLVHKFPDLNQDWICFNFRDSPFFSLEDFAQIP